MNEYPQNVRRKDRQETEPAFLREVLNNSVSCSIAIEKEGFPLIHVAFFHYDEPNNDIVFHFSKYGYAGEEITDGKKVCVSVYKYGKLYTAPKAVDFGCEYQSVILYGRIRIIEDEEERMQAMGMFFDKFFDHVPKDSYETFTPTQSKPIHVARIRIEQWFGKEHLVPTIAADAFFPQLPAVIGQQDI